MDIEGIKRPNIKQQRAQFRSNYYYAPSRPNSPYTARTASPVPQNTILSRTPRPVTTITPRANPQPALARLQTPAKRPLAVAPMLVIAAVLLGVAGIGGKFLLQRDNGEIADSQARTESKVAAEPIEQQPQTTQSIEQPAPSLTNLDEMSASIEGIVAANKTMNIGVAVVDLRSNVTHEYGLKVPFDAASTGKVLTAMNYLDQVEAGKESMTNKVGTKTASEQLGLMIEKSDNNAWFLLNEELKHDGLEAFAKGLGVTNYNADKNTMTPRDLSAILKNLYQGNTLDESNKKLLLDHMLKANKTDFIVAALPTTGVKVYHKAGWLSDRSHDAAIIDNGTHPYILVTYIKGGDGTATAKRTSIMHQITNATVAHFISKDTAAQIASN